MLNNFCHVLSCLPLRELLSRTLRITMKFVASRFAYRKRRRDFGFFCSVDHFSEGRVNANHNITCSPSLAENDSRLFKNSEGNLDGQWIFDDGKRETLLYSCS